MAEITILQCKACGGAGSVAARPCTDCGGAGELRREVSRWDQGHRDAAQLKRWKKEYARLGSRIAVMSKRREALRALMGDDGLPSEAIAAPDPDKKPGGPRGNMLTSTIKQIVLAADRPLSHRDALAALMLTEFAEHLRKSRNGFYSGISKLADRGEIVRYNGHVFAPEVFAKFKAGLAAGTVADLVAPNGTLIG